MGHQTIFVCDIYKLRKVKYMYKVAWTNKRLECVRHTLDANLWVADGMLPFPPFFDIKSTCNFVLNK